MEFNFKLIFYGMSNGTEYSQLLPSARDEVIYQNVGCRTDQTSLWVDTTRHHHLHYVEDEHIYEDIKCESDGDDILNTNISAIELSNNARHHYTTLNTSPLESTLEYPQYSTPLRGANNFHKMSHHPQTHLKNHTYSVNKKMMLMLLMYSLNDHQRLAHQLRIRLITALNSLTQPIGNAPLANLI